MALEYEWSTPFLNWEIFQTKINKYVYLKKRKKEMRGGHCVAKREDSIFKKFLKKYFFVSFNFKVKREKNFQLGGTITCRWVTVTHERLFDLNCFFVFFIFESPRQFYSFCQVYNGMEDIERFHRILDDKRFVNSHTQVSLLVSVIVQFCSFS